ncbi:RIO1 family regulatory kinase/ATPase [Clostridium formicaceticum]|uniref:non-specific serine/threonine protein kinase n=1 Tax=Clostridium formicaceticum TaxID=1497 RepID=A0AAC9RGS3_9CLOT|nr:RIO1 family regulatory kinase/ATPase [Clostridium formicaceticum]AOY76275.1 hypothetical protein BJL90_10400 [Clostridium formicaceticum]ARE86661.1 Phosphotransferase enzyme family protein [Clostridium formicaceticum]
MILWDNNRQDICDIAKIENSQSVERFCSKKNEVYKVPYFHEKMQQLKFVVIKKYIQPKEKMKKEIDFLLCLKQEGLAVPKVYQQGNNYVIMEYIEGKTFLETIEERERENTLEKSKPCRSNLSLIENLIEWMEKFYKVRKRINKPNITLGDVNLRNFIVGEGEKIYGIDFEDCRKGKIQTDGAKLCAYTLTYSPSFTPWKMRFVEELIDLFTRRFSISREIFIKEVEKEINSIKLKRGRAIK